MLFFKKKSNTSGSGQAALVLDFGTTCVKSLSCRYFSDRVEIIGGKKLAYPDDVFDSRGGIKQDSLNENLRQIIEQLSFDSEDKISRAVIGIGGLGVEGYSSRINFRRVDKRRPIDPDEFESIVKKIESRAGEIVRKLVSADTEGRSSALLNSEILDVSLDGESVESPIGRPGESVSLLVYNSYIPEAVIGSIVKLVRGAGLTVVSATSTAYAILRCLIDTPNADGIIGVVDVGGGSSELGIISDGRILGHRELPMAGASFTQNISQQTGRPREDAELLKLGFAAAALPEDTMADIREVVAYDCKVYAAGVELILKDFPGLKRMPEKLVFAGGGCLLPGVLAAFQQPDWAENSGTEASQLLPKFLPRFKDLTGLIDSPADVPPVAIAVDAIDIISESAGEENYQSDNISN